MNEYSAWDKFTKSGSIKDYLNYKKINLSYIDELTEEEDYADQHRWSDIDGTNSG